MRKRKAKGTGIPHADFLLADVLRSANLSQRQVARQLGVDEGHISKLARGLVKPKWATAVALSRILKVSLDVFAPPANGDGPRGRKKAG